MGYVDSNLMPNEAVVCRTKLHGIIYTSSAALLGLAAALFLYSVVNGDSAVGSFSLLVGFVGVMLFLVRWLRVRTSEFAVTDRRVIIKVGIFQRRSLEILVQKVEGIGVDQGLLGKMLGYGTITVIGTGGTKEPFKYISDPLEFRRQVLATAHSVQTR